MEWLSKYGKRVLFPTLLVFSGIIYILWQQPASNVQPVAFIEPLTPIVDESEPQLATTEEQMVVVDVKGAVQTPGVYELFATARVKDAIERAGGVLAEADTTQLNYAQRLTDEMVVYVPRMGEEASFAMSSFTAAAAHDKKININVADEAQLTTLPGIGPAKAQAIIAYRQEHGPFRSIDELKNVAGIGEKTFEKFQHLIDAR